MQTGAVFDATGCYRYVLWRSWQDTTPRLGFILLNPSQADATQDDPTVRRCIRFARDWGYGGIEVMNLFAYRATKPVELWRSPNPIGTENDRYLSSLPQRVPAIVVGWGNQGQWGDRSRTAQQLLADSTQLYCLGLTHRGEPRHPLYLSAATPPMRWPLSINPWPN
jgi:hypothetical protein